MTTEQRLFTGAIVVLLLFVVLRLVRVQALGVTVGLVWSTLLAGALLVLAVPGLLDAITAFTGARFPVSAMTLLAFVVITLFLFYLCIMVQWLVRRHAELVRAVAIIEHQRHPHGSSGARAVDSPPLQPPGHESPNPTSNQAEVRSPIASRNEPEPES